MGVRTTERGQALQHRMLRGLLVAVAYFASGWLGMQLPSESDHVTVLWLPSGIALAALLRWGPRQWPWVLLAATLVGLVVELPPLTAFAIGCGNTLGPWLAARALRALGFRSEFDRPREMLLYVVGMAGGMLVGAGNGALQLYWAGLLPAAQMPSAALDWWLGDCVGTIIAGIPLLIWNPAAVRQALRGWRGAINIVQIIGMLACALWLFARPEGAGMMMSPLLVPLVALLALTVRGGPALASATAFAIACIAAWSVSHGQGGPLHGDTTHAGLLLLWAYIATLTTLTVLLSALLAELRSSTRRLSATLENAAAGIAHVSPEGRWLLVNRGLCEILDQPRESLLGSRVIDLTHPEDWGVLRGAMRALLDGEAQRVSQDLRKLRPDGTLVWVNLTAALVHGPDGAPEYFVTVYEDIGERKRAELALKLQHRIGAAIGRLQSGYIRGGDAEETFHDVLCELLDCSGSTRGLLAEAIAGADGEVRLDLVARQDEHGDAMSRTADRAEIIAEIARVETAFAPVLASGQPMVTADQVFVDSPSGLMLGVPLHAGGQLVGVLAVAGRNDGYDATLIELLEPLFASIGGIFDAMLLERERREAEAGLRLFANVFKYSHTGIMITDADRRVLEVNSAFTAMTGYTRDEVIGRAPAQLTATGRHDEAFYTELWRRTERDGHWRGEVWDRGKNGELFAELLTISSVRDGEGRVQNYVGQFTDITQLKRQQERLEQMAHFDALTQLPNRVLLADRLQQAMALARRQQRLLAVCYLDLDGFKAVNDALGHAAGDELLVKVAERLRATLRESDTLARLGGDEFVALLGGLNGVEEVETTLNRLLKVIAEPYKLESAEVVTVSASIGVALFPTDDVDPDSLLRHADQAMYASKQAGRNCYQLFDAELDRRARRCHEVRMRVEQALDAGEFRLYYQPQVNLRSGEVIGVEALIRWHRPDGALMPPGEFLPMVENTDFAIRLGDWVIGEALRQLDEWRGMGLRMNVSVNLSARHLQQSDFAERVAALLAIYPDIEPVQLELEVLETAALEDLERVSRSMAACRALGVSFAIDDFGTGYSSLSYLKRLPAESLKIDQSFVRDMLGDPDDLAIVRGVIGLAAAFRRRVVAEGVETAEHGRRLLELGCVLAQGYGIARAMPAAELPTWIGEYKNKPLLPRSEPLRGLTRISAA